MWKLPFIILKYKLFHFLGKPQVLPLNITVSVTYRCNSRCKTCNIWKKKATEFSLEEYDKTFRGLGKAPFWVTISGGEPFLRKDIVEICNSAYRNCRPEIINIPTNGLLTNEIISKTASIAEKCLHTEIIVNLSIDEIGAKHDEIRGRKGNFKKALDTYYGLKRLPYRNLTVGIHTVISKFNVDNFNNVCDYLVGLNPDSYITEIAEERVELDTLNSDISPHISTYEKAMEYLIKSIKKRSFSGISNITQSFREEYYQLVIKTLKAKRQIIPCYAGFASAQISPDGSIWPCCIKAYDMGNLRKNQYNFAKIWFSSKAREIRKSIKNKNCFCPLANASYTNMLFNLRTLSKVTINALGRMLG